MPKTFAHIISTAFVPLASTTLLLTGCADYDEQLQEMMRQDSEGTIELRLNIGDESRLLSRAPQGGEHGDGREDGQSHENAVSNILVFYYNAGSGINAPGTTMVTKLAYVDGITVPPVQKTDADVYDRDCDDGYHYNSYYQTTVKISPEKSHYYKYKTGDHYIVITNAGDFNALTLDDVRNKIIGNTWTGTGTNFTTYKDFVMSNEHESFYTSGDGTEDNPHKITVTIERMAARIDFAFVADDNVTKQTSINISGDDIPVLQYPAYDTPKVGPQTKYGEVNLTHVRPFNVKQAGQGSYLIKRSAAPISATDPEFLKPEKAYVTSILPANFPLIVEPTTWSKPAPSLLATWYGDTRSSVVNAAYASHTNYKVHTSGTDGFNGGLSDDGPLKYYVLDYANENTMRVNESLKEYATGYILRAVYKPETVYKSTQSDGSITNADKCTGSEYTVGTTFSRYRPLVTEFDESQAVYFCNSTDPSDIEATKALAKKYGDHILATTGVPYVIETFVNGVCYYPAYIRHDNAGGAVGVTPMEFGVVRNNIYRLKVTFSGPGYTTPEIQSTEPLGIKPYIYTRPWYKVEHEEITI